MIRDSLLTFVLLIVTMHILYQHHWGRRDATDSPTKRSGLSIYTDFGTGVQYVGTIFGSLTVRLDKDGKPMLAPPEEK